MLISEKIGSPVREPTWYTRFKITTYTAIAGAITHTLYQRKARNNLRALFIPGVRESTRQQGVCRYRIATAHSPRQT